MGDYSYYEVEMTGDQKEIDSLTEILKEKYFFQPYKEAVLWEEGDVPFLLGENILANEETKWYCHEEDLLALSFSYPQVLIILYQEMEAGSGYYKKAFKNGGMVKVEGEVVYPRLPLEDLE